MKKILNSISNRIQGLRPQNRFILLLLMCVVLSSVALNLLLSPRLLAMRGSFCYFLARVVQAQGRHTLQDTSAYLKNIKDELGYLGWEAWITDDEGKVITSSDSKPLPLDWSILPKPEEEYRLLWGPATGSPTPNVSVLRLVSSPTRYMVFYMHYGSNVQSRMDLLLGGAVLWMMLLSYLIVTYMNSGMIKIKVLGQKKDESGFTLLAALIVVTILTLSLYALMSMLRINTRSLGHSNTKMAIHSLSDTIKSSVDCEKTLAADRPQGAFGCPARAYCPLQLLDQRGEAIGEPIPVSEQRAVFDPLEDSPKGSAKLGNWRIRAYWDQVSDSIVVRFARFTDLSDPSAPAYYNDPLTKRPYDWNNSPNNPLFGVPDRILCKGARGGEGTSSETIEIVTGPMEVPSFGNKDCTSSIAKNGKAYLLFIKAYGYGQLIPEQTLVTATISCPAGKVVVGGGAQCGIGISTAGTIASLAGSGTPPGYLSLSQPTADGTGWSVACCLEGRGYSNGSTGYAVCAPKPD